MRRLHYVSDQNSASVGASMYSCLQNAQQAVREAEDQKSRTQSEAQSKAAEVVAKAEKEAAATVQEAEARAAQLAQEQRDLPETATQPERQKVRACMQFLCASTPHRRRPGPTNPWATNWSPPGFCSMSLYEHACLCLQSCLLV